MKNKLIQNAFVLSIVVTALALAGCTKTKVETVEEPVQVLGADKVRISADAVSNLKFSNAQNTDFPETLNIMGKVSPTEDRTYVVPARAAGRIETVSIASGETVSPGQQLGTIFSPDYVAAREEYVQSVRQESVKKHSESATRDFQTLSRLSYKKLESLGLSKQDIDKLTEVAKKPAEEDKGQESNLIVRAPRAGAVITKNAVIGNQVNQGDSLFMIADLHQVWFLGDLYPEDVSRVKKDQEVVLDAGGGQTLIGKVSFISPVVDPNSRTIKIRALINNPNLTLRADMYLQGGLVMSHQKALLIPSKSILRDENTNYVFKVIGPQQIEGHASGVETMRVKVATAGDRQGMTAVTQGLSDGDQVVSDGALLLNAALTNSGKQ